MRTTITSLLLGFCFCHPLYGADTAGSSGNNAVENGTRLFEQRCSLCHRGTGPGVFMLERRLGADQSVLENRSNLTRDYIRTVVRWGVGSMPRFSRGEISDPELEAIMKYLLNPAIKTP